MHPHHLFGARKRSLCQVLSSVDGICIDVYIYALPTGAILVLTYMHLSNWTGKSLLRTHIVGQLRLETNMARSFWYLLLGLVQFMFIVYRLCTAESAYLTTDVTIDEGFRLMSTARMYWMVQGICKRSNTWIPFPQVCWTVDLRQFQKPVPFRVS